VIATDHGGARETVVPGSTGWLVPPGDPRALAETLMEAMTLAPEARLAQAQRAIDHVRRHFNAISMAARTLEVYDEILFPAPAPVTATGAVLA
jgi:glycosyltransferase involved in cell wall biosynthesis